MAQNFNLVTFVGQKFKDLGNELSKQALSKYFWKDLVIVFLGVLLYTIGFSFLIYPQRVTTGGLMGICNIITIITGIKVDIPYNIINISLLLVAFLFLDKNFFSKYRNMSFGRIFVAVDGTVVLFSYFANVYLADIKIDALVAFDKLVMSFIEVVLLAMTMDWYTSGNKQSIQFMIFSSKYQEINDAITSRLRRGCTILDATGGYTGQTQKVLLVVVRKQQSVAISRIIEEIDPKAFVSQGAVKGVYGEGFESLKKIK